MDTISVFAGISKSGTNKGFYSLSFYGDRVVTTPSKEVTSKGRITDHFIILSSLYDLLESVSAEIKSPVTVHFYSGNDDIRAEWADYLLLQGFYQDTPDYELWKKIVLILKDSEIELFISGEKSILSEINVISSKKVKKAGK